MYENIKIMLIGPTPPPLGGTTVLFQQLINDLSKDEEVQLYVIDTSRKVVSNWSNLVTAFNVLKEILIHIRKVDVISFHTATRGAFLFGPIIHLIARLFNKPWIFRKFGGIFDQSYKQLSKVNGLIIKNTVLSADISLFECKVVVDYFKEITNKPVHWYPNSRPLYTIEESKNEKKVCQKFAFISQVRPSKGVNEIIEVGKRFNDSDIKIDVYGPFFDGSSSNDFCEGSLTRYCGILQPEQVLPTLKNYDALLLPTHLSEGYPGIILEAYSVGIPVITTRWRSQPELVDHTCGILIERKNVEELYLAMKTLMDNQNLYGELCFGALNKRAEFDSKTWSDEFKKMCFNLIK